MNVYIPSSGFATQGPAPDGFHVPLNDEWAAIYTAYTGLGLSGYINFSTYLKLPETSYRNYSNATFMSSSDSYYWSSTAYGDGYAYTMYFNSSMIRASWGLGRSMGCPIRCIKNTPTIPTESWTKLYGTSIESGGIFWNQTDGLISISSDGSTWYTLQDKNLGATQVYNYGDTLSEANRGKYYQRGNNYGFSGDRNYDKSLINKSSTQVDVTGYGPGNYYESSTWITTSPRQSSANNGNNLRGGTDGNVNITTMKELKNAYIGEYIPDYLCFTANTANSTVKLNKNGSPTTVTLETSTDLENWTTYTFGTTITLANIGDKVYWRNTSTTDTGFSTGSSNYYKFVMTGSIDGSGDINYLLNKNSTTTVSSNCYCNMFNGCTSLTTAPELPATTLANDCYFNMFNGCTNLTTVPSLPATTLATECYAFMFAWCSKIKLSTNQTGEYQTAYRIPTTGTGTTATDALSGMFQGTGGTLTGTPTINTTYYTSNTVE